MNELLSPETTHRLRGLVAAKSLAERQGVAVETVDPDEAMQTGPGAADVTQRLERVLSVEAQPAADEIDDPLQYRRALNALLGVARRTADKLDADPQAPLTPVEAMALEAVVRTDGTRPSLLIRDGEVNAEHPTTGDWAGTLRDTQDALRGPIRAVGRVEPVNATGRNFFGTCWVVDADAGLALTNLHVVEAMWRRVPFGMERTGNGFRIRDGAFVDFVAESGSTHSNRCRIVEAIVPDHDGPQYERLDAAVLKIEPLPNGEIPDAIPVRADADGPAGNLFSFCVVGFPGAPRYAGGVHEGVDWTWVNTTLFGNRYGVKRLAPGTAHRPLGSFEGDPNRWVFGHDPTTLGGNSGSPLLNWLDASPGGFGLHFAGASVDTNIAHAIIACARQLGALGVPVEDPSP